ncbi:isocitrate lyase/PEP mutase family protein [Pseudonocardia sp. GCM10023141]|uniref:isocitrate lyase/PEP mutase family protein n=1 Tax=Pseudonocardia sp. GCM10023141 TaxID=3252653 RepID=UPI00361B5C75
MTPYRTFAALHAAAEPLLLPNAWDVASALALSEAGFPAIGTTSLGVAAAAGVPDAAGLARDATAALGRTLARLPVPITVDIESGFSTDPGAVVALAVELAEHGVAGVNLEDSPGGALADVGERARLVRAIKDAVPELFLNARTDTHWLDATAPVADAVARIRAYADAGADGVFVPAIAEPADVEAVVGAVDVPVNVLFLPGRTTVAGLAELGVRRISTGSYLFRATLGALLHTAAAVRSGTPLPAEVPPYAEIERRTATLDA